MKQILALTRPVVVIVSLIMLTVFGILYLIAPLTRNKSSYVAASLDKEQRLITAKSPRIIFVGGSNLALGLNCRLLHEKTKFSIVNMGLHAGLGLNFILNESLPDIRPGDIVILSIEHFLEDGNKKLMAQLADINPASVAKMQLSLLDRVRLMVSQLQLCFSSAFYKLIHKENDPIYYREGFDKYGDLKTHFNQQRPTFPSGSVVFSNINYNEGLIAINEFINKIKSKGASVYFTYPAFQRSTYNLNKNKLAGLADQYKNSLKCPILGTMEVFVFDDKYIFDTVYHLDSLGIQKRTEILLHLLERSVIKMPRGKNNVDSNL